MEIKNQSYEYIRKNLPNFEHRQATRKSHDFVEFITFWNNGKFNTSARVGQLMNSISKLPLTATRAEWVEYYFSHVRTPGQVMQQVKEITAKSGLPLNTVLEYWFIHILDMSFEGWEKERECALLLTERVTPQGYIVVPANETHKYGIQTFGLDFDRDLGVDLIIYHLETNTVISGIQVKGVPYFLSKKPTVVEARTVINPKKYAKFTELYNAPVFYMLIQPSIEKGYCVLLKAPHTANRLPSNIQILLGERK